MYARAVWIEDGKEMEGTLPYNWIDASQGTVRWPKKKDGQAYRTKKDPEDGWSTYQLVKVKMTSGKF